MIIVVAIPMMSAYAILRAEINLSFLSLSVGWLILSLNNFSPINSPRIIVGSPKIKIITHPVMLFGQMPLSNAKGTPMKSEAARYMKKILM